MERQTKSSGASKIKSYKPEQNMKLKPRALSQVIIARTPTFVKKTNLNETKSNTFKSILNLANPTLNQPENTLTQPDSGLPILNRHKTKLSLNKSIINMANPTMNEPVITLTQPVFDSPTLKLEQPDENEPETILESPILHIPEPDHFQVISPVLNQVTSTLKRNTSQTCNSSNIRGLAVSNPRHRRSRSAGGGERWLDHRPMTATSKLLELNTVLQPNMQRRKSVSKLTDPRDVTDPNTSKYCLTTQEQDSAGELETKLYKGDVLPTVGGGAQVVLTDVEILRQSSPTDPRLSPPRKRSAENLHLDPESVAMRCKTGIEGHSKRPRK